MWPLGKTAVQGHMFLQPRSSRGASGGACRRSGVRRPRPVPRKARHPGGTGIRPEGNTTLTRSDRYRLTDGAVIQRNCWSCAVNGRATP
jgi:hypothetical protein